MQGNKYICPACAYQPTAEELKMAEWAFKDMRRELAELEERFYEGAGLTLEHTLWKLSNYASWESDCERRRKWKEKQDS